MTDTDESLAEYISLVERVSEVAIVEFRLSRGEFAKQRKAACRYFNLGLAAGLSTGELVDFLGVSSPSILSRAGYDDKESRLIMELIGQLTDEEIQREST